MDATIYPLELTFCGPVSSVPIVGNSILDRFLSQIDIGLMFIGECSEPSCRSRHNQDRFDIPDPVHCPDDDKCISFAREMRKIEKIKIICDQDKIVFRSLIFKFVDELEKRIDFIKSKVSELSNWVGKLAFAHYTIAVILMYGITAKIIDGSLLYHHHRKEALKYNGNCVRIWSLPSNL